MNASPASRDLADPWNAAGFSVIEENPQTSLSTPRSVGPENRADSRERTGLISVRGRAGVAADRLEGGQIRRRRRHRWRGERSGRGGEENAIDRRSAGASSIGDE